MHRDKKALPIAKTAANLIFIVLLSATITVMLLTSCKTLEKAH